MLGAKEGQAEGMEGHSRWLGAKGALGKSEPQNGESSRGRLRHGTAASTFVLLWLRPCFSISPIPCHSLLFNSLHFYIITQSESRIFGLGASVDLSKD